LALPDGGPLLYRAHFEEHRRSFDATCGETPPFFSVNRLPEPGQITRTIPQMSLNKQISRPEGSFPLILTLVWMWRF
jgi:hypothetical protein